MKKIKPRKTIKSTFIVWVTLLITLALPLYAPGVLAFDLPPKDQGHTGPAAGKTEPKPTKEPMACHASAQTPMFTPAPKLMSPMNKVSTIGDPIDVATGNYELTESDFYIPGSGYGLSIDRSYNSQNNIKEGPFGFGWTFGYDMKLIEIANGVNDQVIIKRGNGAELIFKKNTDGTYSSPKSWFLSLSKSAGNFVMSEKVGTEYRFNSSGRLVTIANPNLTALSFAYDTAGKLTSVTDSSRRKLAFTYNNNNKVTKIVDPANRSYDYTYDQQNNLTAYTDPNGNKTEYVYDLLHRLTSKKDSKGVEIVRNTYDDLNRVTQHFLRGGTFNLTYNDGNTRVCDRRNNCTIYSYDANGIPTIISKPVVGNSTRTWDADLNLTKYTDETSSSTTYTYDTKGNVLTATDANNHVTQYTYEPDFNKVNSITDPLNHKTTFQYDAKGNLTQITNALNQVVTKITSYDAKGNPLLVEDANGVESQLTYDTHSRLVSLAKDGATISFNYNEAGNLIQATLPDGISLAFTYDAASRLTAIADGEGNQIKYTLDAAGNILSDELFDKNGTLARKRSTVYDQYDRGKEAVTADGRKTLFDYDASDNPTKLTDALGKATLSTYDGVDRLTKLTDALNGNTQFTYDDVNRLTRVTDAKGLATQYTYDKVGNLTKTISPDTGQTTYTYDAADNLITSTDARGIVTRYSYDALNRLTGISYPNTEENIDLSYDDTANGNKGIGRLTGYADQSGTTTLAYDAKGRLASEVRTIAGQAYTTAYDYDAAGKLTMLTYPSGRTVTYAYNILGQVSAVTTRFAGVTKTLAEKFNYLPFGPMQAMTYGNGLALTQTFDQNYRLTDKDISSLSKLNLGYSAIDNITSLTDDLNNTENQGFAYDALSRLTTGTGSYGSLAYQYDAVGNRLKATDDGVTDTYTYPTTSHRLASILGGNNSTFTYDAAGNTIAKDGITFTYNNRGRLAQAVNNGVTSVYLYNAKGERVAKNVGGVVTHFHYDASGQLLAETTATGDVIREYVYLGGVHLAAIDPAGGGGTAYFVHTDHLGTPKTLTSQSGQVVWRGSYEPFGKVNIAVNTIKFNPRFPGQYFDEETGLSYNYFRDYDSAIGRYLESDPIGLAGGFNTYGYVENNPINYVDIYGLIDIPDPNGKVPGGPWEPNPSNRPGNFLGPKVPGGGRPECQFVPDENNGGPKGAAKDAYWKTRQPGEKWGQRYDMEGNPKTAEEIHNGPGKQPKIPWYKPVINIIIRIIRIPIIIFPGQGCMIPGSGICDDNVA